MAKKKASRLRRNIDLLRALHAASRARRQSLLKSADPDFVLALCDCSENVLNGNVEITPARKRTLKKFKGILIDLANRKKSVIAKKKILTKQNGGFAGALLPALLGPVLAAVAGLVNR